MIGLKYCKGKEDGEVNVKFCGSFMCRMPNAQDGTATQIWLLWLLGFACFQPRTLDPIFYFSTLFEKYVMRCKIAFFFYYFGFYLI